MEVRGESIGNIGVTADDRVVVLANMYNTVYFGGFTLQSMNMEENVFFAFDLKTLDEEAARAKRKDSN